MVSDHINQILSEEECERILFNFDSNKKIINYKITKYSEKVFGFLAEHYILTINFKNKSDDDAICCKRFFLKNMPRCNENQKAYIKSMGVFKKEILMYKNLISEFLELTSKPFAARYYFSKSDECIVMEDFSSQNFEVTNTDYLDYCKCKGALQAIARLHAASLMFEEKRSTIESSFRISEHFPEEVIERTFSFQEGHVRNMWCNSATNCLVNLSKFFTKDETVAKKLKEYILEEWGLRRYLKPSVKYRNVICHDDLWRNNMMFNEKNECVLIDFQLTRYTPPIFDVLLLLHINLERDFLNTNMYLFLHLYYNFLKHELEAKGLVVEDIIPKHEFFSSAEEYALPALVESNLYATNVYISEELTSIVTSSMEIFEEFSFKNRSPFIIKEFETNRQFRERFSNILLPLFKTFERI